MTFLAPATDQKPSRRSLSVLDTVQIARPCPADWSAMRPVPGAAFERVRHCDDCRLRVYNLSAMKRADAEALILAGEGRMCVRLYRREDGTVLTADCSYFRRIADKSAQSARRVAWLAACGVAAALGSAVWAGRMLGDGGARQTSMMQSGMERLAQIRPFGRVLSWANPNTIRMGKVAPPQGQWIAGGAPPMLVQGAMAPVQLAPATPPEQWLQFEATDRAPL